MSENQLQKKFSFTIIICTIIAVTMIFNSSSIFALSKLNLRKKDVKAIHIAEPSADSYSSNEIALLGKFITGEAKNKSYEEQVAVGSVIINRVKSPNFPNTIAGVIYQPGAFATVTDGNIDAPVDAQCLKAAADALNGWDPSGGALYYYDPDKAADKWIYSHHVIKKIGSYVFAK